MRQKKRKLHDLLYTEIEKSGTTDIFAKYSVSAFSGAETYMAIDRQYEFNATFYFALT